MRIPSPFPIHGFHRIVSLSLSLFWSLSLEASAAVQGCFLRIVPFCPTLSLSSPCLSDSLCPTYRPDQEGALVHRLGEALADIVLRVGLHTARDEKSVSIAPISSAMAPSGASHPAAPNPCPRFTRTPRLRSRRLPCLPAPPPGAAAPPRTTGPPFGPPLATADPVAAMLLKRKSRARRATWPVRGHI